MAENISELLAEIQDLTAKLEVMGFGGAGDDVVHNGVSRPSIAKSLVEQLNTKFSSINALAASRIPVKLLTDLPVSATELYEVWNDTPQNNGLYGYDGTEWIRSAYDPSRASYLRYSGADAPMQPRSRDGVVSLPNSDMSNAIIDVKVVGAKPGKLYRIEYIGNGIEQWGESNKYVVLIDEYDESNYDVDSSIGKRALHGINDSDFSQLPVVNGVVSRVIKCANDPSIIVSLSYMPEFFISDQAHFNASYSKGLSWVIDPINYVELPLDVLEEKADSANALKDDFDILPLLASERDGTRSWINTAAKDGIIAANVYGAKPGKYYRIEFIGGGVVLSGIPRYDILIDEYEAANYGTDSSVGRRNIIKLGDLNVGEGLVQPSGNLCIQTLVSTRDPSVTVVVVYDPSVIIAGGQMILNTSGFSNYSAIIHPKFYSALPAPSSLNISESDIENMNELRQNVSPLRVDHSQAGSVRVEFDHGDDRCRVNIVKAGANDLMALYSYDVLIDGAWVRKTGSSTDWIGPFNMKAVNNGNGNSFSWSGASHDATGAGTTGDPSAQTDSYTVQSDFGSIAVGEIVDCSELNLTVENSLYAHNTVAKDGFTPRFVMKEVVHYTIKPLPNGQGVSVSVVLSAEPLEPLEILIYYGMQMLALGLDSYWFPGCMQSERWLRSQNLHSGSKLLYPHIDRFTALSDDQKFAVVGWLDPSYGVAANGRPYLPDGEPMGKSSTYSKLYHQLIQGSSIFAAGELIEWRGCYTFTPGTYEGDAFHHVMNTSRGLYLGVDSVAAVDQNLSVTGSIRGKDVSVITQSDGIVSQSEIGATGLKMKATRSAGATYKVL